VNDIDKAHRDQLGRFVTVGDHVAFAIRGQNYGCPLRHGVVTVFVSSEQNPHYKVYFKEGKRITVARQARDLIVLDTPYNEQ